MIKPGKAHVKKNTFVTLCYRLCNSQFKTLEERTATDPLIFLQGYHQLLPAVELALEGQVAGYTTTLKLSPDQAYGTYRNELVSQVLRSQFAAHLKLEFGMKFDTEGPDGKPLVVRITKTDEDSVTLDGNHPLAGQELIFELNILAVREASEEEIAELVQGVTGRSNLH